MGEAKIKENFLELIRGILAGEGGVQYAEGVSLNRKLHYSAQRPSYFNPLRVEKN